MIEEVQAYRPGSPDQNLCHVTILGTGFEFIRRMIVYDHECDRSSQQCSMVDLSWVDRNHVRGTDSKKRIADYNVARIEVESDEVLATVIDQYTPCKLCNLLWLFEVESLSRLGRVVYNHLS